MRHCVSEDMQTTGKQETDRWYIPEFYKALGAKALAWEFLRRNERYVQDWRRYCSGEAEAEKEDIENFWFLEELCDPSLDANQAKPAWSFRKSVWILNEQYIKRNYAEPQNASTSYVIKDGSSPYVVLRVDARIPYNEQEHLLRGILAAERQIQKEDGSPLARKNKPDLHYLGECLMALDARKLGLTHLQIAAKFQKRFENDNTYADLQSDASSFISKRVASAEEAIEHFYHLIM